MNAPAPSAYDPLIMLAVVVLIEGTVFLFTILPAWHGSRVDTVKAITVGYERQHGRSSTPARLAQWLHLPPVVVLEVKDVFTRPLRATLTITALLITVVAAVFAVGSQSTIDGLVKNSMYFQGTPARMLVDRKFVGDEQVRNLLAEHPEVDRYYTELPVFGPPAGRTEPIYHRVLSDDYAKFDFRIQEGRMIQAPGETVVGSGVLTLLDKKIGDDLLLSVDGKPLTLKIVGRHMELYNVGRVVIYSLDTYHQKIDPTAKPQIYALDLASGADARALSDSLLQQSKGQFSIKITNTVPGGSSE